MAKRYIEKRKFNESRNVLLKAIMENVESPVAYNLLGVLYEYSMEKNRAIKFYRIAYYFDQTYAPARNNMERAGRAFGPGISNIDFGDKENEQDAQARS